MIHGGSTNGACVILDFEDSRLNYIG